MRNVLVLATLATLLVPAALAAGPTDPLSITVGTCGPTPIPYMGNATCAVSVAAGCQAILAAAAGAGAQKAIVTLHVGDPPAWLAAPDTQVTFDPANCLSQGNPQGSGSQQLAGSVGLTVSADAPGVVQHNFNVTASMHAKPGDTAPQTATQSGTFNVTYHAAHTVVPSITFPTTMTGHYLNFTVTVTETANARSMVMFDGVKAVGGGIFSGLKSEVYNPPETHVYNLTYVAPDSTWNQTTLQVHHFSHFLLAGSNLAGGENLAKEESWVVKNGNPGGAPGTKAAPLAGAPLMVTLVACALLAGRRVRAA